MGNDPFVDFPGEWEMLALGYTQPLQHFTSYLATTIFNSFVWGDVQVWLVFSRVETAQTAQIDLRTRSLFTSAECDDDETTSVEFIFFFFFVELSPATHLVRSLRSERPH